MKAILLCFVVLIGMSIAASIDDDKRKPKYPTKPTTQKPSTTTGVPTTPDWQNPSTCIGKCPKKDPEFAVQLCNTKCEHFCKCSNGVAYVLACPEGLHYNKELEICDWPSNANCKPGLNEFHDLSEVDIMPIFEEEFLYNALENKSE